MKQIRRMLCTTKYYMIGMTILRLTLAGPLNTRCLRRVFFINLNSQPRFVWRSHSPLHLTINPRRKLPSHFLVTGELASGPTRERITVSSDSERPRKINPNELTLGLPCVAAVASDLEAARLGAGMGKAENSDLGEFWRESRFSARDRVLTHASLRLI